ncbi:MAG: hypothetical protein JNJ85_08445 [Candidatus Kapabacteria bacterium]|nr:hypothetical protein [Candidatus Kapabacteria bacterium]
MIQYLKRQWQPKTSKVLLPLAADELNNELRLYFVKQGKYSPALANVTGHFIAENKFEVQTLYSRTFDGPTTTQMQSGWTIVIIQ